MTSHGDNQPGAGPAGGDVGDHKSAPADGELRHLIRRHDWSATPLGDPASWPACLKIATELMLASSFPTALLWGRQLTQIYNDAYVAILGADHPSALGRSWEETRPDTAPMDRYEFARVFQGETLAFDDGVHPITRPGLLKTSRLRACYVPVRDEHGDVSGIMITAVSASRPSGGSGPRLAAMLERAGVATFECDRGTNLMTMSAQAAEILGLAPGDRIRRCADHDRLVHPDDVKRYRKEVERAAEQGGPYQVDYRVIRPADGQTGWIEQRGTVLRDPETGVVSIGGALWNTSGRPPGEAGAVRDTVAPGDGPGQVAGKVPALAQALEAVIALQTADFGVVHLYDRENDTLGIAVQRGLGLEAPDALRRLPAGDRTFVSARAARSRVRVMIPDLRRDPEIASRPHLADRLGIRAMQATPLLDRTGETLGVLSTGFRQPHQPTAWELAETDRCAAQASEALEGHLLRLDASRRLQALVEGMPQLVWQARDGGEWIWASPQWARYTGLDRESSMGLGWLSAVHPEDRDNVMEAWRSATANEPLDVMFRIWHEPELDYRWFKTRATAEPDRVDGSLQWIGSSADIDELHQLQERQRVLLGELRHRVRNTLAVTRSIARRTAETSDTVHDYAAHLDGRLGAFARVQAVVTRDPAGGVDLENLVAEELLAYHAQQGGQVRISGPPVRLQPKAAEMLGLAIHELATNAVKHGALSGRTGLVEVAWRLDAEAGGTVLVLDWIETGMAKGPGSISRQGFGLMLLKHTLAFDMKANAEVSFDGPGIHWHIVIPVTERLIMSQRQPKRASDPSSTG
jgi:PAS domain S-box-containing protein